MHSERSVRSEPPILGYASAPPKSRNQSDFSGFWRELWLSTWTLLFIVSYLVAAYLAMLALLIIAVMICRFIGFLAN